MKRKFFLAVMLSLVQLSAAAALVDGDIYTSSPAGTNIPSLPYTINSPGAYYLAANLSCSGSNGITINTDNVTLDLMGYAITGPGSANNNGIYFNGRTNVEIRNGTLTGWQYCIHEAGSGQAHRIINVRAIASQDGINLTGGSHLVKGCGVTATGSGTGIIAGGGDMVVDCTVMCGNNGYGIWLNDGGTAIGNVITGSGNSHVGIFIPNNASALVMNNAVSGCQCGIYCSGAVSALSNAVSANSGQTGIFVDSNDYPTLLDQNSVTGYGTHYSGNNGAMYKSRNNAG